MRRSPVRHQRRGYTRRNGVRVRPTTVGKGSVAGAVVLLVAGAWLLQKSPAAGPDTAAPTSHRAAKSAPASPGPRAPRPGRQQVAVVQELDGDTLLVRKPGTQSTFRVRIIGIDTPEISHDGKPAQCGAETARTRLRPLRGESVTLIPDPSQAATDRYKRTLAYVQHGTVDVGGDQVAAGAAREYTYNTTPYARQRTYLAAQKSAEKHSLGLWKTCTR